MICAVLFVSVLAFAFGCKGEEPKTETPTVCQNHNFVAVEEGEYRAPTYESDGRELKKCSVCGVTTTFVIPKLEKLSVTLDPQYHPLLEKYVVYEGDTLKSVQERFFTTGWGFVLYGETFVGEVSETGHAFTVTYTPSENKYLGEEKAVVLIVKAR